jgi:hypothetical protein
LVYPFNICSFSLTHLKEAKLLIVYSLIQQVS